MPQWARVNPEDEVPLMVMVFELVIVFSPGFAKMQCLCVWMMVQWLTELDLFTGVWVQ
jgi:hypothetical protein